MKRQTNKYTKEVEDTLSRLVLKQDRAKAEKLKRYLGTQLNVYGLITKSQVDLYKQGFSFYTQNKEQTFLLLDIVFRGSKTHEGKNQALIYLDKNYKHIPVTSQLKILPQWVKHVDNWAHSDYLSKFLTRLTEHPEAKKEMLNTLLQWNNSKNLWERRQSLVSLFYYARTKKEHVEFTLARQLIKPLIVDKEYFVQKAVGWSLRESYNVYPQQTYSFIEEHIKSISPTAFTTCLEKMTEKEKHHLKQKRK